MWNFFNFLDLEAAENRLSKSLTHYIMGGIYEKIGDFDSALKEYKMSIELDPFLPILHFKLATVYIKKQDLLKAIEELNLVLKYDPKALEPQYLLAVIYSLQNKSDLAMEAIEKFLKTAIELDPTYLQPYKALVQLYFEQKKFLEAEKICRDILSISVDDREAHLWLAHIYEKQSKIDEAIREFKRLLELYPEDHQIMNALGYLYVEKGINLDEAELLIKKALEFEPENGAYRDSLGWLYYKKDLIEEAIEELEKAVLLLKDPIIYEHLGDAYYKKGLIPKAKENWQKALELDPKNIELNKKIENLKSIP